MENWQAMWDDSTKGRELYALIPRVDRFHWNVPHQLIQLLSGHGPFLPCICGEYGDGKHFLFDCEVYTPKGFGMPSLQSRCHWLKSWAGNNRLINKYKEMVDRLAIDYR